MKPCKSKQAVKQLEKRKGGYFYLQIEAPTVQRFSNGRSTRLLCTLDGTFTFQCGLNHLGDGNFFIILSGQNLKAVNKGLGNEVHFELKEDPNPLGVDMPEVVQAVLDTDEDAKQKFEALTLGKKRGLIHAVNKIKDVDRQVAATLKLLNNPPPRKKPL